MARAHGKIKVDVWLDMDFTSLEGDAQWAYFMLLSQPQLSLVGAMDYRPKRWAVLRPDLTEIDVEAAMRTLELARFVCIDRDTDEILVRSMTRHDGLRTNNPKLLKGLWAAWRMIASPSLRKVAVDNMPGHLFEVGEVPPAALEMRRSARMDWANERVPDCAIEGSPDGPIVPPSAIHHPISADARSDQQSSSPVDNLELRVDELEHRSALVMAGQSHPAKNGNAAAVQVSGALTNREET